MVKRKSKLPQKRDVNGKIVSNNNNEKIEENILKKDPLREIRRLQHTTNLLIPRLPFLRLIREIIMSSDVEYKKLTVMAVDALREATECYLIGVLEDAYQIALNAKRVTLFPRDVQLLTELRHEFASQ